LVVAGEFVVSGGDAGRLLEPVDVVFDDAAASVGVRVEGWWPSALVAAPRTSGLLVCVRSGIVATMPRLRRWVRMAREL
jgi:hypothetical protein